jgi:hypothetical protein
MHRTPGLGAHVPVIFQALAKVSMIPMPDLSQWKPEDLLKAVALLGAAIAFGIGLFQYRRAQQWKRAEWVAQEMKLLFGIRGASRFSRRRGGVSLGALRGYRSAAARQRLFCQIPAESR